VPVSAVADAPAPAARCAKGGPDGVLRVLPNRCIGRAAWKTPKDLKAGLYTYYCRIHPFMRGAFRVVPRRKLDA
jgi:hypothetical protein